MSVSDEVIHRAQAGERDAQRELYEVFSARVFRLVRRIVGDADAPDVTQDVFLHLFAKIPSFEHRSAFTTWLHRIVVNHALQHARKRSRVLISHWDPDQYSSRDTKSDGELTTEVLNAAMASIEPELRLVFTLKELDKLPYADIAKLVGIPEGTVASRLNRARRELRIQLHKLGWES